MLMERVLEDDEQLTPRYTDVFAATDFECCVEDYRLEQDSSGRYFLGTDIAYWLAMLPSFGFHWEF
ncbi:MAG TPA: hypothetical protein VFS58_01755 [Steroidobacteraceae bacterium]|nr:hypothetical protein [Steroidobacteraceae bacterium]